MLSMGVRMRKRLQWLSWMLVIASLARLFSSPRTSARSNWSKSRGQPNEVYAKPHANDVVTPADDDNVTRPQAAWAKTFLHRTQSEKPKALDRSTLASLAVDMTQSAAKLKQQYSMTSSTTPAQTAAARQRTQLRAAALVAAPEPEPAAPSRASHPAVRQHIKAVLALHAAQAGVFRSSGAVSNASAVPDASSLPPQLVMVSVHVDPGGSFFRDRIRQTWARWLPVDAHLTFHIAAAAVATAEAAAALEAEHAAHGDLLVLQDCVEGVNNKTFQSFSTVSRLFGALFRFYAKCDTDSFMLPGAYGQVLRELAGRMPPLPSHHHHQLLPPSPAPQRPPGPYVYGGVEYARHVYNWSLPTTSPFMQGGGYFMSAELADHLRRVCSHCYSRPVPLGEDFNIGLFMDLTARPALLPAPLTYVRLNSLQTISVRYRAGGRKLLSCFARAMDDASVTCPMHPSILLHSIKEKHAFRATYEYFARRPQQLAANTEAVKGFLSPGDDNPQLAFVESHDGWFPWAPPPGARWLCIPPGQAPLPFKNKNMESPEFQYCGG